MRIAKMPHVSWDRDGQKFIVRKRIPVDLQSILGKGTKTFKFQQGVDKRTANRLSVGIVDGWDAEFADARMQIAARSDRPASGGYVVTTQTVMTLRRPDEALELNGGRARLVMGRAGEDLLLEHLPVEHRAPPPVMKPATKVEPYEDSVNDWGQRLNKGSKYVSRRMSKMLKLFQWLAKQRKKPGFNDMNAVTSEELIRYEDEVLLPKVVRGEWKHPTVRDHLIDIKAQFAYARGRLKIDTDPAVVLKTYDPDDGENDESASYEKFTKTEAHNILTAAAGSTDPVIKYGNWLASRHGSRVAEIVEARTNHIYQEEETGLWVFDYTLAGRPKGRRIKTGFSARKLPIPDFIVFDLGLLEYVEAVRAENGGKDGDLFPMLKAGTDGRLNTGASRVLMAFLRDDMDIKAEQKVFHSWRSYVASALEGKVPETRARKITGHAPRTRGEKYIQHDLVDLAVAIALIPMPAIECAKHPK